MKLDAKRVAMNAWQVLGALWGTRLTPEQQRICNYFWAIAHDEEIPELFPLSLDKKSLFNIAINAPESIIVTRRKA